MALTDTEWSQIFELRCRAKRGERLQREEQRLVEKAFKENPTRYAAMNDGIFEATKPFGTKVTP